MIRFGCALLPIFLLTSLTYADSTPRYAVTDLGTIPGAIQREYVDATAINNAGQVVGIAQKSSLTYPFLWNPVSPGSSQGAISNLGLVPNVAASWDGAFSINNAGQIVGYATNPNYSNAFLWTPDSPNGSTGSFTVLPNPPGTTIGGRSATSINNSGVIVGAEGAGGGGGVRPYFSNAVFVWHLIFQIAGSKRYSLRSEVNTADSVR